MTSFLDLLQTPLKKEVFLRELPPIPDTTWVRPSSFPNLMGAKVIAYDTETKEEDFEYGPGWARGKGHIIGVSIAAIDHNNDYGKWYFPVRHEVERHDNLDPVHVFGWLKHTLENTPNVPKVGANLIYDNGWLAEEDIYPTGPLYDVQFAEALIDEKGRTELGYLGSKYVQRGKNSSQCKDWVMRAYPQATETTWKGYLWRCPPRLVGPYAEDDADLPIAILPYQWAIMQREETLELFFRECKSIPMMIRMRQPGITIDLQKAEELHKLCDVEAKELYAQLTYKAGFTVDNVNSPKQLQMLFDAVGVQYPKTATGKASFRKEWLAALADTDGYGKIIGDIREREKLRDTFLGSYLLDRAARISSSRGLIYCTFHPLRSDDGGTKTGRYSCVDANTKVLTSTGYKRIADICVGELVWTHANRWRSVIETQVKGHELMYDVRLSTGHVLTCTDAHKMLTDNGNWMSLGEYREREQKVGFKPFKCRTDVMDVSSRGLVLHYCGDCAELRNYTAQHTIHNTDTHADSRGQSACCNSLLEKQASRKEPYVREERRTAPQLDRTLRRRKRLFDVPTRREETVCASSSHGNSIRHARATRDVRNTPHRHRHEKQCNKQPGAVYSCRAHNDTLVLQSGQSVVSIETINAVGIRKVYDITVAEDHSYYACGVFSHNSSHPNLQNIPSRTALGKKVRQAFTHDYGHVGWHKKDHSQIEYRLFAHYAVGPRSDEIRWRYNNDPSTDYHNDTMADVAVMRSIDLSAMSKDERERFRKPIKNVNFGLLYGQTEKSLAYKAGWSEQESKDFFTAYHAGRPFVKTTMQSIESEVQAFGYVQTIANRRTRFDLWEALNYANREGAYDYDTALRRHGSGIRRAYAYRGVNYKFQGSAAEVLKEGMLQCYEQGVYDYIGFPKLQVHDELDWSKINNTLAMNDAYRYAAHVMEQAVPKIRIPLKVDSTEGNSWGDCA